MATTSSGRLLQRIASAIAMMVLAGQGALAQSPRPIGTFSGWRTYAHGEGPGLLCFAAGRPSKQEPQAAKRDPAYFYLSSWPKDGVKAEVSVRVGYPLKKGSELTLVVGGATFKLFANGDRAYVADATQELKLVEGLRTGTTMIVRATSERGTRTTDTYTLAGLSQAIQALATSCK